MKYLVVAIGGALGSVVRYLLGKYISQRLDCRLPFGTFIINITGAFLLGVVSTLNINQIYYSLLADGFLGAYTTFSTFMYEGFNLFKERNIINAIVYIALSLLIGIIGYIIGVNFVQIIF